MSAAGLTTVLGVQLRSGWKVLVAWIAGLGATMVATTTSISGLYDTQAKIDGYAAAVTSGSALEAINGRIAGIDTLGGVVANEFGFVASAAIPLMGIGLVARATRREEEQGRLESLLAGRVGRAAPVLAAVLVATAALVLVGGTLLAGLVGIGVPLSGAASYAGSMVLLGLVFVGLAALLAQLVGHARSVQAAGLGVLVAAYLLRGAGDVQDTPLTWASPLGWQEQVRAFGDARAWPLLLSASVGLALAAAAVVVASRRDLGAARFRRGGGATRASRLLRSPWGLPLRTHRGLLLGWSAVAVAVGGTFGALAQPLVEAIEGNPAVADVMGSGGSGPDAVVAMSARLLAVLLGGYVLQALASMREEESAGRLETALARPRSRWTWWAARVLTAAAGLVVVAAAGALALAVGAGWSTGEDLAGATVGAVAAYLPAVLVLAGLAALTFGTVPRAQPVVWLAYAAVVLVAFLGEPLRLPAAVRWLSPFEHVGSPPEQAPGPVPLLVLGAVALLLTGGAYAGFRRRDVPA